MVENKHTVSRRSFLAAVGAAGAAVAVPVSVAGAASALPGDGVLDGTRRWYEETVDAITRQWEPRFRHRQYRRTDEDSADCETRESPQDEIEHALEALPVLRDPAMAYLVLAASRQDHDDIEDAAPYVMAKDVLDQAERLGYFTTACPKAFRFPDLPLLGEHRDDLQAAESEVESAEHCERLSLGLRDVTPGLPDEWYAEQETRLERARARLAALRSGTIPALTERHKLERHTAERRAIIGAYKARLEAAGRDASWVDVDHACYAAARLREIAEDEAQA